MSAALTSLPCCVQDRWWHARELLFPIRPQTLRVTAERMGEVSTELLPAPNGSHSPYALATPEKIDKAGGSEIARQFGNRIEISRQRVERRRITACDVSRGHGIDGIALAWACRQRRQAFVQPGSALPPAPAEGRVRVREFMAKERAVAASRDHDDAQLIGEASPGSRSADETSHVLSRLYEDEFQRLLIGHVWFAQQRERRPSGGFGGVSELVHSADRYLAGKVQSHVGRLERLPREAGGGQESSSDRAGGRDRRRRDRTWSIAGRRRAARANERQQNNGQPRHVTKFCLCFRTPARL